MPQARAAPAGAAGVKRWRAIAPHAYPLRAEKECGGVTEPSLPALSQQLSLAINSILLALALIQGFPTDSATAWVTRSTT
jgi:hypothetical protein